MLACFGDRFSLFKMHAILKQTTDTMDPIKQEPQEPTITHPSEQQ